MVCCGINWEKNQVNSVQFCQYEFVSKNLDVIVTRVDANVIFNNSRVLTLVRSHCNDYQCEVVTCVKLYISLT